MGAMVLQYQQVELRGSGFDLTAGMLDGEALRWSDSVQKSLGTGAALTASFDKPGKHALTLQAISAGGIGDDQIEIMVVADADRDGLADGYEAQTGCLKPGDGGDAALDQDGDGLSALTEAGRGTNPCDPDSDDDKATDGAEVAGGSNPLDAKSQPLPAMTAAPASLVFYGCLSRPAPPPQKVAVNSGQQPYQVASSDDWLKSGQLQGGALEVSINCAEVEARGETTGELLLTTAGRRPFILPVVLRAGLTPSYLPLLLR
jgi:hypothetical protein